MRGVCDRMSPVKAKVIAVGAATVVGAVETTVVVDDVLEVVAVQPVAMQANANVKRLSLTQPIYCGSITAVRACYRGLLAMNSTMICASCSPLFSCKK